MGGVIDLLLIWKWAIAVLIVAAVTGTTMISAANVSSTRTIQCRGTIVYRRRAFDLNLDGRVDIIDVAMVARASGSCVGHERWDPSLDVDRDGQIGEVDLSMMVSSCWRK